MAYLEQAFPSKKNMREYLDLQSWNWTKPQGFWNNVHETEIV